MSSYKRHSCHLSRLVSIAVDAIVLAGGRGSRLAGADKAALVVAGKSFLERSLDAAEGAARIVVVGPRRDVPRQVTWTIEEPRGGGPVAAIAAGLNHVTDEAVAVVAVDLPFLTPDHLSTLGVAAREHDGAIYVDEGGRDQPLAGVYKTVMLREALARIGEPTGASVASLVHGFVLARIVDAIVTKDCDTAADLVAVERAFALASRRAGPLLPWRPAEPAHYSQGGSRCSRNG